MISDQNAQLQKPQAREPEGGMIGRRSTLDKQLRQRWFVAQLLNRMDQQRGNGRFGLLADRLWISNCVGVGWWRNCSIEWISSGETGASVSLPAAAG